MSRGNMKKFIGSIKRSSANGRSKSSDSRNGAPVQQSLPEGDHPEAVVVREAVAFCEAGAPGSQSAGDEYLHLPAIVDACESSPSAAREAAVTVQRYLSKQNFERGYAQYNAIMLMRILTDNPGRNFTQNFDKNFNSTMKALLRECRDSSVQQITRETLDYFEAEKLASNDSLMPLMEMWRKEKGTGARMYSSTGRSHSQGYSQTRHESRQPRGLPPPEELAARIEEAKTSARLLVQMCQSTPPEELVNNELIKEFAERARQAHRSIQHYMACESPAPDEHTMLTLIETSEQLSISMTKHQRALLQARRAMGQASAGTSPAPQPNQQDPFNTASLQNSLPPQQPPRQQQSIYSQDHLSPPQPFQPQQQQQQAYRSIQSGDLYNKNPGAVVSPVEQEDHSYMPPSGPPPQKRQDYTQPYQPDSPVSPPRPAGHTRPESVAKDYDVSENPFADENAYTAPAGPPPQHTQPAQPQSNSYSLFNRAAGQLRDPTNSPPQGHASELDAGSYPATSQTSHDSQERPGLHGYNSNWQPTPSFMGRQASSEAHITMSGASPPTSPVRK